MIFLFRHGQTNWNLKHRVQGDHPDVPLNATGCLQAEARMHVFDGRKLDAVITSPLRRARTTGAILTKNAKVGEQRTDRRLKERNFGPINGQYTGGREQRFYYHDYEDPDAESIEHLRDRVGRAIDDAAAHYPGDVVIVAHAAALGSWLSGKLDRYDFTLDNVGCIAYDPKTKEVVGFNLSNDEIADLLDQSPYQNTND